MASSDKYEKYKQYENNILDDRYIIDKLIGVGGMAVVFRARDTYLNNMTVAIKILKDDVSSDEVVVKRFRNESKAEGMLKHNNIVAVHNVSTKGKIFSITEKSAKPVVSIAVLIPFSLHSRSNASVNLG